MKKRIIKGFTSILLTVITLFTTVAFAGVGDVYAEGNKSNTPKIMKAVWVSYIDLCMETKDKSFKAFKSKFNSIVKNSKSKGFNTLVVQVRPFNDALYKSKYFPYSHILTGVQGKSPNYDPLKYMVKKAHSSGLSIQAWINPYRVRLENKPSKLSSKNPYVKDKGIGVVCDTGIYLNPCLKRTTNLIVKGVEEIVKNYDVDGIQFDDYFYPTTSKTFDKAYYLSYVKQTKHPKSLSRWRKDNVNKMIKKVYSSIKEINPKVEFGISPQGNYKNNDDLYADVKRWCQKKGYVDYICPQIYWSLKNPTLTFDKAMKDWTSLKFHKNLKLYVGLAGYKAGTTYEDFGTWKNSNTILKREYKRAINKYGAKGVFLFSYASLLSKTSRAEVNNLSTELKKKK